MICSSESLYKYLSRKQASSTYSLFSSFLWELVSMSNLSKDFDLADFWSFLGVLTVDAGLDT